MDAASREAPSDDTQTLACRHCGTHFHPREKEEVFCCQGCAYVYRLLHEKDLSRFYDLKDQVTAPVGTRVFGNQDWQWLENAVSEAEAQAGEDGVALLNLGLQGASCLACVWLVERLYEAREGAVDIRLDVRHGELQLRWQRGRFDMPSFAEEMRSLGYLLCRAGVTGRRESRALGVRLGLCAAFAMNTMLATLPHYLGMEEDFVLADTLTLIALLFATASMLTGGMYFIRRAWSSLRLKTIHMDVPIAVGLIAAYVGSLVGWMLGFATLVYFDFVAIFVLLMLFGRWLQEAVLEHNRTRYLDVFDIPEEITCLDEKGDRRREPIVGIARGWILEILPNGLIPVAGRVREGVATLNLQYINGEQETRVYRSGEPVPSGSIHCGSTAIQVEALETWPQSLMARLTGGDSRAYRNDALERVLRSYLVTVMLIALAGGAYWWLQAGLIQAAQVSISVLVVSCPCAIGVALPLLDEMIIIGLRRRGLYVRSENIWGKLRALRRLVFDKTGTLTLERPVLRNPEALDPLDAEAMSMLLRMVRQSLHPLARSLNQELSLRGLRQECQGGEGVEEVPGSGIQCEAGGHQWRLGKPGWANDETDSGADLVFCCGHETLARFHFEEQVRESSRELVRQYSNNGYSIHILSGDKPEKVFRLAESMGLTEASCLARQSPEDKAEWISSHEAEGVLMIGDGMNDSLALDAARCSGVVVTDVNALGHKADFLVMGSALRAVATLLNAARKRQAGVRMLFALNVVYNLSVVSIALAGMMSPLVAAIVMPLSSVVSTLIALTCARRLG